MKKAFDLYIRAAKGVSLKAKWNLAYMHYFGAGVRRDFKKAAAKGHGGAQFFMCRMNMLGQGVGMDVAKAYYWFPPLDRAEYGQGR